MPTKTAKLAAIAPSEQATPTGMKFLCAQSDLNACLGTVSRAVPSRPTHPVLANVLMTADAATQRVSLTAFDLSFGIQASFPAEVGQSGEITLPAKLLGDIVGKLPSGALTIEQDGEGVKLTAQSGRYSIQGMGAEEFTLPPEVQAEPAFLPADALLNGLGGTLFSASPDETKQVLTGVHLTAKEESLEFAATDGHRLAVVKVAAGEPDEDGAETTPPGDFEVTVPARVLREVERLLKLHTPQAAIAVYLGRGDAAFQWGDYHITSRTLDGQYPAYPQLIPRQFDRRLTVNRKALLGSLERIAVLAGQKSNHIVNVHIESAAQRIHMMADAQDVGSGRETLESNVVQISGDDIEIAFNVLYLMESLKNLQSTEVQVQMNTPTSPVVLSPLGGINATHLVMPVQIRR